MAQQNIDEAAAMKQAGYGGANLQPQQDPSPFTNYENKEGYGGEGYKRAAAAAPREQQPDFYSAAAPQPQAPPHEQPKPGMMQKVKEKLPCVGGGHHAEPAPTDAASPPKKGVIEKVKEKLSPHSTT